MSTALIVCIGGGIIFAIARQTEPRLPGWVAEMGRLAFFAGLLATLLR